MPKFNFERSEAVLNMHTDRINNTLVLECAGTGEKTLPHSDVIWEVHTEIYKHTSFPCFDAETKILAFPSEESRKWHRQYCGLLAA